PGSSPFSSGRIQICSRWTGSVCDALASLWRMPRPAVMRWLSPGRMMEPVPMLQRTLEHIGDDFHVAVRMRGKASAGSNAVFDDYPQRAKAHEARVVIGV